jgi:type II secretory pathway component PulC
MINKFKDFLKNLLSRGHSGDLSGQEDFSPQENELEKSGPTSNQSKQLSVSSSEKLSRWKNFLKALLPVSKKNQPSTEQDEFSSSVAEQPEKLLKTSWKEKVSQGLSGFGRSLGKVSIREWKLPDSLKTKKGDQLLSLSPNITKFLEKFLSREARESIHQFSLAFLICGFTYLVGKLTALALKGHPPIDSGKDYAVLVDLESDFNPATLGQIKSSNIFRTNTGLGSKKKLADTKCEVASQSSNLPIKLVNTIVLQDSVKSLASVQIRGSRELEEVREGDQISNIARLFKITRLEILIKNLESGVCESISSESAEDRRSSISVMSPAESRAFKASKKMAGIENSGNSFKISKALLDEKMKDIGAILTQARAIKIQNPDGSISFKLTEMDPQGIFPYLGLQDQDIITSINGKQIYDMNEVMSLFARIKNLDKLQLGVKREGNDSLLDYNIKK